MAEAEWKKRLPVFLVRWGGSAGWGARVFVSLTTGEASIEGGDASPDNCSNKRGYTCYRMRTT